MTEDAIDRKRRGFWLWMSRERKGATLADAAKAAGLELGSASTISLYEAGQREVPIPRLKRLASFYGIPLRVFTDPEVSAFEQLDRWAEDDGIVLTPVEDAVADAAADEAVARDTRLSAVRSEHEAPPGEDTPDRTDNQGVA